MLQTQTWNKSKLNKHIKDFKTHIHKITRKIKKSEMPKLETLSLYQNSLELDFDHSPQSIYSQSNKRQISKLRIQRSWPKEVPIKQKWLEDVLSKTHSLVHYFLVNLMCFYHWNPSSQKMYLFDFILLKNKGLGRLSDNVGFVPNRV